LIVNKPSTSPKLEREQGVGRLVASGNHWQVGYDFEHLCRAEGFRSSEKSAAILDLDETILGAQGRNDAVINQARVAAVTASVESTLRSAYDADRFRTNYEVLNAQGGGSQTVCAGAFFLITEFHLAWNSDNPRGVECHCLIMTICGWCFTLGIDLFGKRRPSRKLD